MSLILLEALAALGVLLFIVWWTMFAGRHRGERRDAHEAGERRDAHEAGERRDAPDGAEHGDADPPRD